MHVLMIIFTLKGAVILKRFIHTMNCLHPFLCGKHLEAVGDGLAMVGLDVRYGNRLFIHPDENGYLVDFDIETDYQNKDKLCERTAAAIVKIFEDDDRLKKFHENSYMIAEEYKEHVIESKWMQLIKNILDLNPSNLIS